MIFLGYYSYMNANIYEDLQICKCTFKCKYCNIDICVNINHFDQFNLRLLMAMKWHRFPKNEEKIQEWKAMISKDRNNFHPGKRA